MTDTETTTEAPEAAAPTEATTEQVETFDREYVEKLRKENATYRTKAKEAAEKADKARTEAERAKLDEVERLKVERADALKEAEAARAEAKRTRHLITLAGKVTDPEDALLIAERAGLVTDDGVDLDALLKAKPYLAPPQPGVNIPGARTSKTAALTPEDVQRMTPDQINERWAEVQTALKR
jgi:hypothetical protein